MSVHAPLANRRQTMATASLRQFGIPLEEQFGFRTGLEEPATTTSGEFGIPLEELSPVGGTITLQPMVTTADEPTAPTTVSAKTLSQDPGFIWLAAGTPDFPAFTTWTHPPGTEVRGALLGGNHWIQLFGPDATQWMLERINSGLAVLRNGAVAPPIMVVPTQEVVGGEPLAPTQVITTTADLEPSAPSLAVDTGITGGTTILRGATTTPITTGVTRARVLEPEGGIVDVGIGAGAGAIAALAIGALFLFGRRR